MPTLRKLLDGETEDEFECAHCGTLILISLEELEESDEVWCSHCGGEHRYDPDNFRVYSI